MANVAYPPFFPAQILDGDGQPVANGSIRAAFAGSDVPAPLFTPDGTALGSSVTLNSSGEAVFCLRAGTAYKLTCLDAQGATVWTRDNVRVTTADSGMANPMEAEGDMIVGAVDGQPERLAPGTEGQALKIVSGVPAWATDEEGMQNPMTTKGDLIVGGTGGEPSRLGVGAAGEVLTSDGTTWAPAAIPTQTGDHKAQVSATDSTPNYLQNKIVTGDLVQVEKQQIPDGEGGYIESLRVNLDARGVTAGYVPTADGSNGASWAAPATQPGDHQLLVSATDAAAGYLGAKLVPGSNITITPQTDGDGVQTLEISATGGGGGGGAQTWFPNYNGWGYLGAESFANNYNGHIYYGLLSPTTDCTPRKAYARCRGTQYIGGYTKNYVGIYEWTSGSSYSLVCASDNLTGIPADSAFKVIEFNFSTTAKIYANKVYMFAWLSDKQWTLSKSAQYYLGGSTNKLWSGHFSASSLPASFDANSGAAERYQPYFDILAD